MAHSHGNDESKVRESLPSVADSERVAACFSKLGDGTRLRIFCVLCHNEECVTNLASIIGMSSPAVAHHLRLLKDANLVVSRRMGKEMHYRIADTDIAVEIHKSMDALFHTTCNISRG